MKKLTLDQAWKLCLAQWKWIIEQLDVGNTETIATLKRRWLRQKRIKNIVYNCFFCEYDEQRNDQCKDCPGKLISPRFRCMAGTYHFEDKPRKFYAKLQELYKKYQESKKKSPAGV